MGLFESASGCRMWYEDLGSGTPLVFIHGWCMSSSVWKCQQDRLSETFRIISVDLRGHGQSSLPEDGFSIDGCVLDLAELLEYLSVTGAILVGWSLGAFVAVETIVSHRGRFAGLVLVGATPCFVSTEEFPHGLSALEVAGMLKKVERNIERALAGFKPLLFSATECETSEYKTVLDSVQIPSTATALQALQALTEADMRSKLPLVDCPVLVIHGDTDRICLPQASRYISEHIAASELLTFPECGHAPFITQCDSFNEHLKQFLGRIGHELF